MVVVVVVVVVAVAMVAWNHFGQHLHDIIGGVFCSDRQGSLESEMNVYNNLTFCVRLLFVATNLPPEQ